MTADFSFDDAIAIESHARKLAKDSAGKYGWKAEGCKRHTVLNPFNGGETFKSVSYVSENGFKRNKTKLGDERIRMIFDYTEDEDGTSQRIFIMLRPILGSAYVSFNSCGFCEDSLSAYFSKHGVPLL